MSPRPADIRMRVARSADATRLQVIRRAAFAPVFASFRSILGAEIYARAQQPAGEGQEALLAASLASGSEWTRYFAESGREIVGFVSVRCDSRARVGEIGLNAVDPVRAGRGIGTAMYQFALKRLTEAGMKVATVATGGDLSHAAARRAYRKAGFDVAIPSVWMCCCLHRRARGQYDNGGG